MGYNGLCYTCHHQAERDIDNIGRMFDSNAVPVVDEGLYIANPDDIPTSSFSYGFSDGSPSLRRDHIATEEATSMEDVYDGFVRNIESSWGIKGFKLGIDRNMCRFCGKKFKDISRAKKLKGRIVCNNCYDLYCMMKREFEAKKGGGIRMILNVIEDEHNEQ